MSLSDGTAIRRGPYTDCDDFGLGYPSHGIDVHCGVHNANGVGWVYLRDTTTSVTGWARTDALRGAGTIPNCYS